MLKNLNNLFNSQLNQTLFFIKNYIIVYYIINMLKKLKETKMKKPKAKPKPKQKQKQKQNVKQIVKVNVQSTGGGGSGGASAIPPSFSNRTGENVALLNIIDQLKQSIRPPIQPPAQISTRTEGQPEIPYDPVNDKTTVNDVFNAPINNNDTTWEQAIKKGGRPKLSEEEKLRRAQVEEEAKAIARNEALQKRGEQAYQKELEAELSKKEQISGGGKKKNKSTKSKGVEMRFPITDPYFEEE